ncbi:tRNA-uridine aminocarboxypropyltransferase [Sulfurimonas sp.]
MTIYGDREKCYVCYRPKSSCMCRYFEYIKTKTKFIILMHPKEFKKVKNNTGHFTHKSLPNSELFVGIDFTNHKGVNEIIATHESYILFPSQEALNITTTKPILKQKNMAIFLIDSTWGCTQQIFKQSKNLQKIAHMSFTTRQASQYKIKEQPDKRYLSTIESTLVVLKELQKWNIENIQANKLNNFLNPFHKMIAYQQRAIKNSKSNAARFKINI